MHGHVDRFHSFLPSFCCIFTSSRIQRLSGDIIEHERLGSKYRGGRSRVTCIQPEFIDLVLMFSLVHLTTSHMLLLAVR